VGLPRRRIDGQSRADKFRDMARELERDEDEAAFKDKVRKVATAPKPEPEKAP